MPVYKASSNSLLLARAATATAFEAPSLAIPFTANVDEATKQLVLTWREASAIKINKCTVSFRHSAAGAARFDSAFDVQAVVDGSFASDGSVVSTAVPNAVIGLDWYMVEVEVDTAQADVLAWVRRSQELERHLGSAAAFCSSMARRQAPNDACLDFTQLGRRFWTTQALLSASSPFFKDLLSSDFVEGSSTMAELSLESTDDVSYDFDDSDAETDAADLDSGAHERSTKPLAPYKRIAVTETAYTTYLAGLVWLQTRHIKFAPLASSFRSASSSSEAGDGSVEVPSRNSKIKELMASQDSALPPPASPKSVYRLADYLSLDDLKQLALAELVSKLTPSNALYELYGDVATVYPAVRGAVLDYVVENWKEVKASAAVQHVEESAEAGALRPGATKTAMLLAKRLAEVKA